MVSMEREMKMAEQLIGDMSASWSPEEFKDEFTESIMKLVEQKVRTGKTESVTPLGSVETNSAGAQIICRS